MPHRTWTSYRIQWYCKRLDSDQDFAAWFERIETGIVWYAYHSMQGSNRLAELNARLSELIEFLDPDLGTFLFVTKNARDTYRKFT